VNCIENELFISHRFGKSLIMNNSQYYSFLQ